ncbi:hypothetical protein Bhyg_08475 [Pseudolycoriella hygida]|uniref:Uncharacterized protein n=1 Tax=Pseudolycoriella hygida TaxID=35572 RepID=A0A9Q0S4D7_9DIPT|nr:hypothetical protein Bhyg_08475 [Pseudolycoriella hygida]
MPLQRLVKKNINFPDTEEHCRDLCNETNLICDCDNIAILLNAKNEVVRSGVLRREAMRYIHGKEYEPGIKISILQKENPMSKITNAKPQRLTSVEGPRSFDYFGTVLRHVIDAPKVCPPGYKLDKKGRCQPIYR